MAAAGIPVRASSHTGRIVPLVSAGCRAARADPGPARHGARCCPRSTACRRRTSSAAPCATCCSAGRRPRSTSTWPMEGDARAAARALADRLGGTVRRARAVRDRDRLLRRRAVTSTSPAPAPSATRCPGALPVVAPGGAEGGPAPARLHDQRDGGGAQGRRARPAARPRERAARPRARARARAARRSRSSTTRRACSARSATPPASTSAMDIRDRRARPRGDQDRRAADRLGRTACATSCSTCWPRTRRRRRRQAACASSGIDSGGARVARARPRAGRRRPRSARSRPAPTACWAMLAALVSHDPAALVPVARRRPRAARATSATAWPRPPATRPRSRRG